MHPTRLDYGQSCDAIRLGLMSRIAPRFVTDDELLAPDLRVLVSRKVRQPFLAEQPCQCRTCHTVMEFLGLHDAISATDEELGQLCGQGRLFCCGDGPSRSHLRHPSVGPGEDMPCEGSSHDRRDGISFRVGGDLRRPWPGFGPSGTSPLWPLSFGAS